RLVNNEGVQKPCRPESGAEPISDRIAGKYRSGHQSPEYDAERDAPLHSPGQNGFVSNRQFASQPSDVRPAAWIAHKEIQHDRRQNLGRISSPHNPRHPSDSDVPPKDRPFHRKRPEDVPARGRSPIDNLKARRGSPILSESRMIRTARANRCPKHFAFGNLQGAHPNCIRPSTRAHTDRSELSFPCGSRKLAIAHLPTKHTPGQPPSSSRKLSALEAGLVQTQRLGRRQHPPDRAPTHRAFGIPRKSRRWEHRAGRRASHPGRSPSHEATANLQRYFCFRAR